MASKFLTIGGGMSHSWLPPLFCMLGPQHMCKRAGLGLWCCTAYVADFDPLLWTLWCAVPSAFQISSAQMKSNIHLSCLHGFGLALSCWFSKHSSHCFLDMVCLKILNFLNLIKSRSKHLCGQMTQKWTSAWEIRTGHLWNFYSPETH